MSWRRLLLMVFSSLFLLVILLIWMVLFSESGNQMLWQQMRQRLPHLQGELVSGHLGKGWEWKDLDFDSSLLAVKAAHLKLNWQLTALVSGRLPVTDAELEQVEIHLHPISATEPETRQPDEGAADTTDQYLHLPFKLDLERVRVRDFLLTTPDVRVVVGQLDAAASWQHSDLRLHQADGAGVEVQLLPSPDAPAATAPSTSATPALLDKPFDAEVVRQHIETLPKVFFPFALTVEHFAVNRARYHQDGFDTGWFDTQLTGRFKGTELDVDSLAIQHELGDLALNGHLSLVDYYPLKATLSAHSRLPWLDQQLKGRDAKLVAEGPLTDLNGALTLTGQEQLTAQVRLNTLAPDLPFTFSAAWKALQWPLVGTPDIQALSGQLESSGHLSAYQARLTSQLKQAHLPDLQLDSQMTGSLAGLEFKPLSLKTAHSSLQVNGQLGWTDGLRWQGQLQGQTQAIKEWLPDMEGRLSLQVTSKFDYAQGHWQLSLPNVKGEGVLNGYVLNMAGKLAGNDQHQWQIDHWRLTSGGNEFSLNGKAGKAWDLKGQLSAPHLERWHPGLKGNLQGKLALSGDLLQPRLIWSAESEALDWDSLNVKALAGQGDIKLGANWKSSSQLSIGGLKQDDVRIRDIRLSLTGDAADHEASLQFSGKPWAGLLVLRGKMKSGAWVGHLAQGQLDTPAGHWQLESPLALDANLAKQAISIGAQCWRSDQASLCLSAARLSPGQGEIGLELKQFSTRRLDGMLPSHLSWNSALNASGKVGWSRSLPQLDLQIRAEPGSLSAEDYRADYAELSLNLLLNTRQGDIKLHFLSKALGQADVNLHIADPLKTRQLSGDLAIKGLSLEGLAPLYDEVKSAKGRINASGRFAGTLTAPLFYGQLSLQEGGLETSAELAKVTDLNVLLKVDGARATLDGGFKVGKGRMQLGGFMDWQQMPLSGRLTFNADTLEVGLMGYGRARVSSNLTLQLGEHPQLLGQVQIPWARIKVKSLPDSAVSVSDDVTIISKEHQGQPPAQPSKFAMNVTIGLGGDVTLDAMGLKTALVGSVRMAQPVGETLRADGEIRLVNGRFKSFGQNLLIQEGKLMFNGPLTVPYLSVKAERDPETMDDKTITVGVKVSGPATQPKIDLYSEPQMAQAEVLSYLLRGKSTSASGATSNDEAMKGVLLGAGLSQANGVVGDLGDNIGLHDLSLDSSGSGTETKVNISGYLLPGLQLQYGVGVFSSISEVKLKLELMPRLYLQALSGLNQALDLIYKFEF